MYGHFVYHSLVTEKNDNSMKNERKLEFGHGAPK